MLRSIDTNRFLDAVEQEIVRRSGMSFGHHSSPERYRRWIESRAYPKHVRFLISVTSWVIVEMHVKRQGAGGEEWNRKVSETLRARPHLISAIKQVCPEFVNDDDGWDWGPGQKGLHLRVRLAKLREWSVEDLPDLQARMVRAFLEFRAVLEPELDALKRELND